MIYSIDCTEEDLRSALAKIQADGFKVRFFCFRYVDDATLEIWASDSEEEIAAKAELLRLEPGKTELFERELKA